jgi:hypothetical protein
MTDQRQELPKDFLDRILNQRNTAAIAFVGFLIGLAYQEAVAPVRASVRASGITFTTVAMFVIFFLLGLSLFLASYYSLLLSPFQSIRWLLHFGMFVVQSVVLIFMAGVATLEASRGARFGFVDVLFLYTAIGSIWAIGTLAWTYLARKPEERRAVAPFVAASLLPFGVVASVQLVAPDRYARMPIALLMIGIVVYFASVIIIFLDQRLL